MMLGVAVGIMLLSGVVSISNGVEKRIEEEMKFFGARSGVIFAGGGRIIGASQRLVSGANLKLEDVEYLRAKLGNKALFSGAYRRDGISIKYQNQSSTTQIFAVEPDFLPIGEWEVSEGEPIDNYDIKEIKRVCLLGTTVKKNLFEDEDPIGKKIHINNIQFVVKGVMKPKGTNPMGFDLDDVILIPLSTGMKRVFHVDRIRVIRFKVREEYDLLKTQEEITEILKEKHRLKKDDEPDFQIRTPIFIAERIREMTRTIRIGGYALAIVALIVGGVVLMNILLLSVSERIREIGLKRALGATKKQIFFEFIVESLCVTFLGMFLGVILGFIPIFLLPKLIPMLPIAFTPMVFLYGSLFSLLIGIIFGVQPARRAANLVPIEALR